MKRMMQWEKCAQGFAVNFESILPDHTCTFTNFVVSNPENCNYKWLSPLLIHNIFNLVFSEFTHNFCSDMTKSPIKNPFNFLPLDQKET